MTFSKKKNIEGGIFPLRPVFLIRSLVSVPTDRSHRALECRSHILQYY